ncbi:hypothetical protein AAG747_05535 [Rapidithrix thailandica]|uniref:Uncharacterized protein n=1 Tax=Rapidithrix thailandica TaxID=413964 RepID=A0AAW9S185_9BACT
MTFLEKLIKDKGPILSGEILETLTNKKGISNAAARKRLSRLGDNDNIYRVRGLFADGQITERYTHITKKGVDGIVSPLDNLDI